MAMDATQKSSGYDVSELTALREQLASLQLRIAALEKARAPEPASSGAMASERPLAVDELLVIISAALAAHLGVKPHIRQIRLLGGASWAQVGRVTIQASHVLQVR
jgi:methylmalonyl-CoA carboxyltransferase large subunit